jgi:hypothetical protein
VAGKPFRPLMDESCLRTNARNALVVGDRLDTDIAGAQAAGLPSLLVLTGVSGAPELLRAEPRLRPTYLATDLFGLHRPHAAPRRDDTVWVGENCRAFWVDHADRGTQPARLVVEDLPGRHAPGSVTDLSSAAATAPADSEAVDALRVVCAALWERVDEGGGAQSTHDLLDAAELALRPWTTAMAVAR